VPRAFHEPEHLGPAAWSWAVYDFGYSLFAFVIFARYLSDWLITDLGHPDFVYTSAQAVTALALLILMPLAGVLADVIGRHMPLLMLFTAVACISGGLLSVVSPDIGVLGVLPILALASVCAAATGLAFAQFDPLLAAVAPKRSWGTMSGIAVAMGYVGIVAWLVLLGEKIVGEGNKQQAFFPAAVIFAALAIPAFLFIREPRHVRPGTSAGEDADNALRPKLGIGLVGVAFRDLRAAVGRLREQRAILRLLAGRFLYTDAVGTVNIYAVVYVSRLGNFNERDKDNAILLVVAFAGLGAIAAGGLARRFGPRRTLLSIMPLFSAGIMVVAIAGAPWTIWLLSPVVGVSLGTVYAVDRVFMLALTPPELRGELFGFFNLVGRVAQAMGPFVLWGGTIWILHNATGWLTALDASRVSLGLLAISAAAGIWVIRPLDDGTRRVRTTA